MANYTQGMPVSYWLRETLMTMKIGSQPKCSFAKLQSFLSMPFVYMLVMLYHSIYKRV